MDKHKAFHMNCLPTFTKYAISTRIPLGLYKDIPYFNATLLFKHCHDGPRDFFFYVPSLSLAYFHRVFILRNNEPRNFLASCWWKIDSATLLYHAVLVRTLPTTIIIYAIPLQ